MKKDDIQKIAAAGLITPEQEAAIVEHFHLNRPQRHWLMLTLSCLAAALIVAGIIMLVSANWDIIPPAVKMGVGAAIMAALWGLYAWQRESRPVLAETLAFLGAGMWLGNIALYGQIFQLQNPIVEGTALFFAGIVFIPFVVRQRLLIGAVAVTSCVLSIMLFDTDASASWLSMRHLLQPTESRVTCLFGLHYDDVALIFCTSLLLLWWLLGERFARCGKLTAPYGWVAVPAALAFILFCSFATGVRGAFLHGGHLLHLTAQYTGTALVLHLLCGMEWRDKATWLMALARTALPFILCISPLAGEYLTILLLFIIACVMMGAGSWGRRIAWVNYGSIVVCVSAFLLMADVLHSYTESGLMLIGGGLFLLVVAVLLEKQRRFIIRNIKNETSSDHE